LGERAASSRNDKNSPRPSQTSFPFHPPLPTNNTQVGDVNKNIKQSNTRVKSLLTEMRPARNFCVDATLLCILLAIGLSIYNAVMQQKAKAAAAAG
jgi:hypothetical protein